MIPVRVALKNFLCYSDQVFEFDGHQVWLLHGPNGVGKSAIFDAMVYALFGEHKRKDGSQSVVADLIRRGENALRVDFDFEFRGRRYQIWRTRGKNGKLAQGVFEIVGGKKEAVRDVNSVRDLDGWVSAALGFTYETFVSAVLLRQGSADKLIDADKDVRRKLFRGIIDLEPFIELHGKVCEAKSDASSLVKTINGELQANRGVTPEALSEASKRQEEAQNEWQKASDEHKAIAGRLKEAQSWEPLDASRRELRSKIEDAAKREASAGDLGVRFERFSLLRSLVPALSQVASRRIQLEFAAVRKRELEAKRTAAEITRTELSRVTEDARERVSALGDRILEIRSQQAELDGACKTRKDEIEQAGKAEKLRQDLADKKSILAAFAPDLDGLLTRAEMDLAEAKSASISLPLLETMVTLRADFSRAEQEKQNASAEEANGEECVTGLTRSSGDAGQNVQELASQQLAAQKRMNVAEERLSAAVRRRNEFSEVAGEALCSVCQQPIDEKHARQELLKFEQAAISAEQDAEQSRQRLSEIDESLERARTAHEKLFADLKSADEARKRAGLMYQHASKASDRARSSYDRTMASLSEELRGRSAAVSEPGFPSAADVEIAQRLSACVREREAFRERHSRAKRDREEAERAVVLLTEAVAAAGSPADMTQAKEDLAKKERELADLIREVRRCEESRLMASNSERDSRKLHEAIGRDIDKLSSELGGANATHKHCEADLELAIDAVPADHRRLVDVDEASFNALATELEDLHAAKVEQEWDALAQDRAQLSSWNEQLTTVESLISKIPEHSRRPEVELKPEFARVDKVVKEKDGERLQAAQRLGSLKTQLDDWVKLDARLSEAQRSLRAHEKLAELLGEKGIQVDLVRQAEHRIIRIANDILVRVSSGDLCIEPPDPSSDRSFEINVRRSGCPEPIAAANLSGGQRFRLAVSLALAVCKFASGERVPLESVIIDEGFGSLDREGRMAMIRELRDGQELSQMFKRVLIVSHQEDFAQAFPVGYTLSSQDGTTVVEPFDRR